MKKILFAILIISISSCNESPSTHEQPQMSNPIPDPLTKTKFVSDSIFLQNQAIIDSLNTTEELLDYLSSMPVD